MNGTFRAPCREGRPTRTSAATLIIYSHKSTSASPSRTKVRFSLCTPRDRLLVKVPRCRAYPLRALGGRFIIAVIIKRTFVLALSPKPPIVARPSRGPSGSLSSEETLRPTTHARHAHKTRVHPCPPFPWIWSRVPLLATSTCDTCTKNGSPGTAGHDCSSCRPLAASPVRAPPPPPLQGPHIPPPSMQARFSRQRGPEQCTVAEELHEVAQRTSGVGRAILPSQQSVSASRSSSTSTCDRKGRRECKPLGGRLPCR